MLGQSDMDKFRELGVRCIIDFRSKLEYSKASGNKVLDESDYELYQVKHPHGRNYRPQEEVRLKRLGNNKSPELKSGINCVSEGERRAHFLIDFFTLSYAWTVFNRAPWYMQLYSLIFLFVDIIFHTGYKYFVRFFARNVLNHTGLVGQYKDIIDMSQRSICAALKLLTDSANIPALLNCAHGKDRTGIVSALILSCLGKPKEYIAQEYSQSKTGVDPIKERLHEELVKRFHMSEEFLTAEADTMLELLDYISDKYGSVETYLEMIGFGASEQEKLRQNLGLGEEEE